MRFATKTNNFYIYLLLQDYDIIALNETWLTVGISNYELFHSRYTLIRRHPNNGDNNHRGGGVLVTFKKQISIVFGPDSMHFCCF